MCGRRDDVLVKERYPLKEVMGDHEGMDDDGTTYKGY